RAARPARVPAVHAVRQRGRHGAGRVRHRARLGRDGRPRPDPGRHRRRLGADGRDAAGLAPGRPRRSDAARLRPAAAARAHRRAGRGPRRLRRHRRDHLAAASAPRRRHHDRYGGVRMTSDDRAAPERTTTDIDVGALHGRAAELFADGHRLALVAAHHDPDAIRVVYLFTAASPDRRTELQIRLDPDRPAVPSLAALSFPAGRFEREMRDLYGVVPEDHPLPRRLVRHHHWPRGWYPMRADAGPPPEFGDPEGPYPFVNVEGPGVYEIPVGPVHAGMIGPGHFRFSAVGESILKLKARLWFVHRGLEKLFHGRAPADALPIAERVSGDTTVGHALAFCMAVEEATGVEVSPGARRMRAMLLELERLYNHVTDLGALCNDVAHSILNSQFGRVRE